VTVPVLLLPVRLETRFDLDRDPPQLRVRIFPDAAHVSAHSDTIHAGEAEALTDYTGAGEDAAAFERLVTAVGGPRARYLVQERPTDIGATGTPAARGLPERFTVICRREDGGIVAQVDGAEVSRDALPCSPLAGEGGLPAWMRDFDEAVEAGMAVRVPLGASDIPGTDEPGLTVQVVGLAPGSPEDGQREIGELLRAHAYGAGLDLVPPDTPTNHTASVRSPVSRWGPTADEIWPTLSAAPPSDPDLLGEAAAERLIAALGLDPTGAGATALARCVHAGHGYGSLQSGLTGVVWRRFLRSEFHELGADEERIERTEAWALDHVCPDGPLPTLRVGREPYGIVPIRPVGRRTSSWPERAALLGRLRAFWESKTPAIIDHRQTTSAETWHAVLGALSGAGNARARGVTFDRNWFFRSLGWAFIMEGTDDGPGFLHTVSEATAEAFQEASTLEEQLAIVQGQLDGIPDVLPGNSPLIRVAEVCTIVRDVLETHLRRVEAWRLVDPDWPGVYLDSDLPEGAYRVVTGERALDESETPLTDWFVGHSDSEAEALAALLPDGAERERALARAAGLLHHRLDAWWQGVTSETLSGERQTAPTGLRLGAYGVVEDLHPRDDGPSSGYLLAPDLASGRTAAILRAAYHSQGDEREGALAAVRLDSRAARRAEALLDALRGGRPLEEALGRALLRDLRDVGLGVLLPEIADALPVDREDDPRVAGVPDGLKVALAWLDPPQDEEGAAEVRGAVEAAMAAAGLTGPQRSTAEAVLLGLAGDLDALSDLVLAEGVHLQAGALEARASAWRAAFSTGERPPPESALLAAGGAPQVTRRLVAVVAPAATAPAEGGWAAVEGAGAPVERWLRSLLGSADDWGCRTADGGTWCLEALETSALGLVSDLAGDPSTWLQRVGGEIGATDPTDAGEALRPLSTLAVMLPPLATLVSSARFLTADELAGGPADNGLRVADLLAEGSGAIPDLGSPDELLAAEGREARLRNAAELEHQAQVHSRVRDLVEAYQIAEALGAGPLLQPVRVRATDPGDAAPLVMATLAADPREDGPMAAFVVASFSEPRARPTQDASVVFHHDAPQSHAPQVWLLGLPHGDLGWSTTALLGVVDEALALSRMRAIGPRELGELDFFLPLGRHAVEGS